MIVFVGNSDNYKALYEEQEQLRTEAEAKMALNSTETAEQIKKSQLLKEKLDQDILDLKNENNSLSDAKQKAERLAQQYLADADKWKGVMAGFEQSVGNLQASLDKAQQQLDDARAQGIKDRKELSEITADLYEKIVQLQDLEAERRRLMEQKTALEAQLASGAPAARPKEIIPVTQLDRVAAPAPVVTGSDIKGQISAVGESMVQLTVGSADGVTKGMKFHITRGDVFLCDIVVTDVDINKCAGVLELVQDRPQVGDTASTQL